MLQEAAAPDGVAEVVAFSAQVGDVDGSMQRGAGFVVAGVGGGEAAEVVVAEEGLGAFDHAGLVEPEGVVVDEAGFKGRADFAAIQGVAVGFGDGVVAGVEVGVGFFAGEDPDVAGEEAVDRLLQVGRGDGVGERKPNDLG